LISTSPAGKGVELYTQSRTCKTVVQTGQGKSARHAKSKVFFASFKGKEKVSLLLKKNGRFYFLLSTQKEDILLLLAFFMGRKERFTCFFLTTK
jgi:hypothetical protein